MARIQVRIHDDINVSASAVIEEAGLTISDVVCMFLTNIAVDRALPVYLFRTEGNVKIHQSVE
ncbi:MULTISPECIES: type II toxin-antitoxin system RelB/DinJ family antitoxin [unclassified Bartonella]|uniref:type II toxin-antitoxin system RelB/DinJ family antitoxin n=1 Tax=Bartonella TaxID=773 RepID=UPI0023611B7F|nr:type II toxin-antitoxin system RelB/DinJ family antitoxin [Bartonella sp. AU18XJBT]